MKPLHEIETDLTLNEYKKLHRITNSWRYCLISTVLFAPLVFFVPFYFVDFRWISMLIVITLSALGITAAALIYHFRMKKLHRASAKHFHMRFFDDRIEQESESGTVSAEYSALEAITETRTNLYLRISKNHTVVLIKADCPDELVSFLKTKLHRYDCRIDGFSAGLWRAAAPVVSIVLVVIAMGFQVMRGNMISDMFSYKYHCPLCYRAQIATIKAQQKWVDDYLNWEYSTVNGFVDEYILPVLRENSEG